MNANMLKARMLLADDTIEDLASDLGIHRNTFVYKMKKSGFRQNEISQIIKRYGLTSEEIRMMFFEEGDVYGTVIRH